MVDGLVLSRFFLEQMKYINPKMQKDISTSKIQKKIYSVSTDSQFAKAWATYAGRGLLFQKQN